MSFDSAMDSQRHVQDRFDHESRISNPRLKTPLLIERHASEVYTRTIFYKVQKYIYSSRFHCSVLDISEFDGLKVYKIKDKEKKLDFEVLYDVENSDPSCSCKKFERIGLLCPHIFYVLSDLDVDRIPSKFVLDRWTKDSNKKSSFGWHGESSALSFGLSCVLNDIWAECNSAIRYAGSDKEKLEDFLGNIRLWNSSTKGDESETGVLEEANIISTLIGSVRSADIEIRAPKQVSTKGSGSTLNRRMISQRDKAINLASKAPRLCAYCKVRGNHDIRNCEVKKSDEAKKAADKRASLNNDEERPGKKSRK